MRAMLKDWDPIPGSPIDEYDLLVHRLLSALHAGASTQEIAGLLRDGAKVFQGLPPDSSLANAIMKWWSNQDAPRG